MIRKFGTGIKGLVFNWVIKKDVLAVDACCNRAVFYNPYNEVIQCHVCGHVFVPKDYQSSEQKVKQDG